MSNFNGDTFGDDSQSLIKEEISEVIKYELGQIQLITSTVHSIKSSLILKLEADPTESFLVSNYSRYVDDRWIFVKKENRSDLTVRFNSEINEGNKLKKMIVYFLMPQTNPFGRIRSYTTTTNYSYTFNVAEKFLFKSNCLDASPESIKVISAHLINQALDNARENGTSKDYIHLYFFINFWFALSSQSLLPSDYCLSLAPNFLDYSFRQNDIQNSITLSHIGWQPFNESELEILVSDALLWLQNCIPVLIDIKSYVEANNFNKGVEPFIRAKRDLEFEDILGRKINETVVCGFRLREQTVPVKRVNNSDAKYTSYFYRWRFNFKKAVDNVSNRILVLLALLTGLRSSEISYIKFEDVIQMANEEWVIKITRYKTSEDPNFFGQDDFIPIPSFLGHAIRDLQKLRDFDNIIKNRPFLFINTATVHETKVMNRAVHRKFLLLGSQLGIESVHCHRFRKTIAEILINRNERNIDLIRFLFGHRSYTMTLRYIARNPYLVKSVAETLEINYAESFYEIVNHLKNPSYSGEAADRIAKCTNNLPSIFKGKLLRTAAYNYIKYLLLSGEPLFIKRSSVGIYCVSNEAFNHENLPPCRSMVPHNFDGIIQPDISNCKLDCNRIVVVDAARESLEKNISFYQNILNESLKTEQIIEFTKRLKTSERLLSNLNISNSISVSKIES